VRRRCIEDARASGTCSERRTRLWAETHYEFSEIRDLGDRIVAIGRFRARGKESAAEVESPLAYIVQFKNGKAIRMWSYFDPNEALEAAGLRE
jgi:ketosteroid isomerase-like protein